MRRRAQPDMQRAQLHVSTTTKQAASTRPLGRRLLFGILRASAVPLFLFLAGETARTAERKHACITCPRRAAARKIHARESPRSSVVHPRYRCSRASEHVNRERYIDIFLACSDKGDVSSDKFLFHS